ncbi:diaminopimelate epimerase [bacterium]|nr:diaminopimelate epimerase [bacterium]
MRFSKLHGLGNDFVVVDALQQRLDGIDFPSLAQAVCDRHFGIGADGLILVLPSDHSDLRMRIFNADGSEPQMCGNGIRCFAKFAFENKLIEKEIFSVETLAGVIVPALIMENGRVSQVEVDMGPPYLTRAEIPMLGMPEDEPAIEVPVKIGDTTFHVTAVSMGNPHAVIFVGNVEEIEIDKTGPLFEHHPLFPERTNTEFVSILNRDEARMRVWERGSGETLACGTGACAVAIAGVITNRLNRKSTIHLPGGDLQIEWLQTNNHVIMTGPAHHVFDGEINI